MALAHWDVFTNTCDSVVTIKTAKEIIQTNGIKIDALPIIGASSLLTYNYIGDCGTKIQLKPKRSFSTGQRYGRFRSLIQVLPTFSGIKRGGFYCLSSQENILEKGNCYLAYFTTTNKKFNFIIGKSFNGLEGPTQSLSISPPRLWSEGKPFALEFEWQVIYESVFLTLRLGSELDFSNLVKILYYEDKVKPFRISVGEGLFHNDITSTLQVLWGNTRLEKLSL